MRNIIIYPVAFDAWHIFHRDVREFADSFKKYPPGIDYELWAMCCWGEPIDDVRDWFYGIKTKFLPHYSGCESSVVHRETVEIIDDAFVICFTTRTFFHRAGWLKRLCEAREKYGYGLYGCSTSLEADPHICTRSYALDAQIFRSWPGKITNREDAWILERGDQSLTRWCWSNRLPTVQVLWDSEQANPKDWRKPDNIFRRGNQEQILVWDRHTRVYSEADEEEQKKLEQLTDGK